MEVTLSPFIKAALAGDAVTLQSLLENGADKNEAAIDGKTALWHATNNGHLDIVRLLVEQGADKEWTNDEDGTPLWIASSKRSFSCCVLFVGTWG